MMETYLKSMKGEWLTLLEKTDQHIRRLTAEVAYTHAHDLSETFYRIVLTDPMPVNFSLMPRLKYILNPRWSAG
ncbi:putative diguanylate cyclase yddV domain protein [Enterobacter cloacae S611]|uniref:Diguanylate cyclase yddV domain protein n=1 Tax=Enterobacter cloacae S611 TaxID=1399146 RepID=A0ABN0Q4J4_ENTCL|nr:putative diguanylate cyclase yddV domain protein [Enterobacter cloacae S611]